MSCACMSLLKNQYTERTKDLHSLNRQLHQAKLKENNLKENFEKIEIEMLVACVSDGCTWLQS